jgi:hypothetical protein
MGRRLIFSVQSPLGYRVKLARDRWRVITRFKHPAVAGKIDLVRECVSCPDAIRESDNDSEVHIYYKQFAGSLLCVVAAPVGGTNDRFVVTAYFTRKQKEGVQIWTK